MSIIIKIVDDLDYDHHHKASSIDRPHPAAGFILERAPP
jgi:hypothetical protein